MKKLLCLILCACCLLCVSCDTTDKPTGIVGLDEVVAAINATTPTGCVVVTKELAEILQKLMDKYTFENVDNSWIKLCYYYDHMG